MVFWLFKNPHFLSLFEVFEKVSKSEKMVIFGDFGPKFPRPYHILSHVFQA
jgi:hypothetical protein